MACRGYLDPEYYMTQQLKSFFLQFIFIFIEIEALFYIDGFFFPKGFPREIFFPTDMVHAWLVGLSRP